MARRKTHVKKSTKNSGTDFDAARPKIISALKNGRFIARTVNGIAKETSLSRPLVVRVLKKDKLLRSEMKVLPRRTKDGRILLTTKDHFSKTASIKDKFIDVFATNRVDLDDIE